jgi:hypothetical protein
MIKKRIHLKYYLAVTVVLSAFIFSSCQSVLGLGILAWQLGLFDKDGDKNHDPQILTITAVPNTVARGGVSVLTVVAVDSDQDNLTYLWTTTNGTLQSPTQAVASWTAPADKSGTFYVNITVSDGKGSVTGNVAVVVN